jgi:hypothetical protein
VPLRVFCLSRGGRVPLRFSFHGQRSAKMGHGGYCHHQHDQNEDFHGGASLSLSLDFISQVRNEKTPGWRRSSAVTVLCLKTAM